MGALTKIGYAVTWSGGDCRVHDSAGGKVAVQVINGCPMVEKQVGMKMMDNWNIIAVWRQHEWRWFVPSCNSLD